MAQYLATLPIACMLWLLNLIVMCNREHVVGIEEPSIASAPPPAYADVVPELPGGSPGGGKADSQHRRRVVCEVCRTSLTYADRAGLRVVRCSRCQEATVSITMISHPIIWSSLVLG